MQKLFTLIAALLVTAIASSSAFAQPLADKLPDDTLLYVGWSGEENFGKAYDGTHMQALVKSSEAPAVMAGLFDVVANLARTEEPEAAELVTALKTISSVVWRKPGALYFGGLSGGEQGPPLPKLAIVIDAGDQADALQAMAHMLVRLEPQAADAIQIAANQGMVVLSIGPMQQSLETALLGKDANALMAKPSFKRTMGQLGKSPAFAMWADVEGIMGLAESIAQQQSPRDHAEWMKFKQASGLGGLRQVAMTGSFSDKMWQTDMLIDAPAPREGLLSLMDGKPLDHDVLSVVPRDASIVTAFRLDPYEVVTKIKSVITAMEPQAEDQYQQARTQVQQMFGFDLEDDLLKGLGDQWVIYADRNVGGRSTVALAMTGKLRNPEGAQKAFMSIGRFAKAMGDGQLAQIGQRQGFQMQVPLRTNEVDGLQMYTLSLALVAPTWSVVDDRMYVGMYPQVVHAAHAFAQSGKPSIIASPKFLKSQKQLGEGGSSTFQYADLDQTLPDAYGGLLLASTLMTTVNQVQGKPAPAMMVPPIAKLSEHVEPIATRSWTDDAGWHWRGQSPFPGSSLLITNTDASALSSLSSISTMVGVLMPALGASRRTARQMKGTTQLRGIQQAMVIYAQTNNQIYPPDIGAMLVDDYFTAEYMLSPDAPVNLPNDFDEWPDEERAKWARENTSFIMTLYSEKVSNDGEKIAGYQRPDHAGNGIAIVYDDGHAEFFKMEAGLRELRDAGIEVVGADHLDGH